MRLVVLFYAHGWVVNTGCVRQVVLFDTRGCTVYRVAV